MIRRRHVWEDALHYFKQDSNLNSKLKVTFVGEPAVDEGLYHIDLYNVVSNLCVYFRRSTKGVSPSLDGLYFKKQQLTVW